MQYVVVGLGNPGEEYENTRHNVGRMVAERVALRIGVSDWRDDKKSHARIAKETVTTGDTVLIVLPENYMNRSGGAVAPFVQNAKQAERLIVVQDDIDLPVGKIRVVFNRGSGGHRGVDSIIRALKTKSFTRVRVGVVPTTPTGKLKKPTGDSNIHALILNQMAKKDRLQIDTMVARAADAVLACITDGREFAMCAYNSDELVEKVKVSTHRS